MAKVLFVQTIFFELIGTMSLSAYLKSRGHDADLIIETSPEKILRHIDGANPDIIAFSSVTGQHTTVLDISSAIKQAFPRIPIILGGAHPTFFPEIIEKDSVDIVCRGEGEEALADLMDRLDAGADITDIPNLWVKKGNSIVKNEVRPLVDDLDALPFPDRTIYDKYSYLGTHPMRRFMSGRGCPYECNFCFNHALRRLYRGKGKFVRMRSQGKVIEEIKLVADMYPTMKRVKFEDDTFTLNKSWALRFLQAYKEQVQMPFACYSRADCVDDDLAQALKDAGCDRLDFGLETGSEYIRNEILNKKLTNERIMRAAEVLRHHGIPFGTANMFGLPGETLKDALETLKLNLKIKPSDVWGAVFQPYPGTECGRYVIEKGYCRDLDADDIRDDYQTDSLLVQEDIREVVNLHKFFYLLVMFPASIKLIRPLLSLPGNSLFTLIHRVLYFWGYAARTKGGMKQTLKDVRMAMKRK